MRSLAPLLLGLALQGCAVYDAPPEVTIAGLQAGLLTDAHAPIVLDFSKVPQPATIKLEIAKYIVDGEGRLGDEQGPDGPGLSTLFAHDPVDGDTGGDAELSADGTSMTITPTVPLPVGGQLVVVVEPGLADLAGAVTRVRRRVVFGYASMLNCTMPAHVLTSGTYFFLAAVTSPVPVQIQLFGAITIDDTTGQFKGKFTKAKRNPDLTRCSPSCPSSDVCRTLPGPPACVAPSTVAGSVDEFPDYVPNLDPTTGFTFAVPGCAVDQDAMTAAMETGEVDVVLASPPVTLRNTALTASFVLGSDGTLRGTGSLTADAVLIGTIASGKGVGNLTARSIPADQVPPNVPQP